MGLCALCAAAWALDEDPDRAMLGGACAAALTPLIGALAWLRITHPRAPDDRASIQEESNDE